MPKKSFFTLALIIFSALLLNGCNKSYVNYSPLPGVSIGVPISMPHTRTSSTLPSGKGGHVKTGKPYKVAGKWYYPLTSARNYDQTGTASWYGKKFHGRKTANGERYDMHAMSAAHKTLPLPTMVRVTNLDNGRSVVVRVNDRGPFVKNRIIDLSYAAARSLGYDQKGTARVRVQTLDGNVVSSSPSPAITRVPKARTSNISNVSRGGASRYQTSTPDGSIYVQLGAFSAHSNADQLRQELVSSFPSVRVYHISQPDLYRVRIGPFNEVSETEQIILSLQQQGYNNTIVVIE
ncbi:MAG: septal ring lytic transglycosylase RlpA family protein [Mariprofundaceae bacterium]|nr:septal ring lytic transglycosylase RlpA family protein [Mariprofundaceae bacterium]